MINAINIKHLRIISLIEGTSYLLLIFVGMPLKYGMEIFSINKILGMGHGILTILFCMILAFLWSARQINGRLTIGVFIASLIPFGALWAEHKLKQID